ncbi:MAG: hypothetical protein MUD16_04770 [Desulfobacterales bacterium]|jgi:hypothetical protein|nr:hypothetical protein [Desulfobacterales bacterium]
MGGYIRAGVDENIGVAGAARCAMEGQRATARDQIFRFMRVEQREQVSEVWLNLTG